VLQKSLPRGAVKKSIRCEIEKEQSSPRSRGGTEEDAEKTTKAGGIRFGYGLN